MRAAKILTVIFLLALMFPSMLLAKNSLYQTNQLICDRFQTDVNLLAAIMDEKKSRLGITQTRVAFGGVDTPVKSADYWVTYAAEAIAYQRAQQFSSLSELRNSLEVLKNKILKAKAEVGKALDTNE